MIAEVCAGLAERMSFCCAVVVGSGAVALRGVRAGARARWADPESPNIRDVTDEAPQTWVCTRQSVVGKRLDVRRDERANGADACENEVPRKRA